jgi:ketosteroid isomerase-like protein
MLQENAEIVRRFYERWSKQDLDGVLECAHPEIEFDWSASRAPFGGVYTGHEGLTRFWTELRDAWEEFSLEIVEVVECDGERLVTVTVVRGRGRGSGIRMEAGGAMLWTLREGTIVSGRFFQNKEEALKAAGLLDQDNST